MDNYSPEQLLNIWKKGEFLNDAVWSFTDNKIRQEYDNINIRKKEPIKGKLNIDKSNSWLEIVGNSLQEYQKVHFNSQQIKEIENKLYNNLYGKITKGNLVAVGYKLPIKSDFPDLIPPYMWPPKNIDINKSDISAHNINFTKVKIIKKSAINKITNNSNKKEILSKVKIEDKKVGRPSIKGKIISAYNYLKENNKIDYSKTLKSHTEIIQEAVMQLYPEIKTIKGMAYEAIRRTTSDLFNADKETSKSTSKL